LGTKAKSVGQPACRVAARPVAKSAREPHIDFTVVSGYLECLILVAVLVVLGLAEAILDSL
jgi:hypothetical protein